MERRNFTMHVGIAYSNHENAGIAARNAVEEALDQSGGADLTILFTTNTYTRQDVLSAVAELVGKVVGCCTAGILTPDGVIREGIGVCTLKGVKAITYLSEVKDPWKSGEKAGEVFRKVKSGTTIIFPDGFIDGIPELLRGFYNSLGPEYVYVGGGSGDNLMSTRTQQFTEKGIIKSGFAAAIIDVTLSAAVGHGWRPLTDPMIVTKTSGKKIYEIEGEKAFEVYSRYVECDKENFAIYGMKYPFGLPCACGSFIIRDPIALGDDGSIELVSEVPQNSVVTIMGCENEEIIKVAEKVVELATSGVKKPRFALVFDCISRMFLLGSKFEEEIKAIKESLPVPFIGPLTFGEIYSTFNVPVFHNKTVVVAVGGD